VGVEQEGVEAQMGRRTRLRTVNTHMKESMRCKDYAHTHTCNKTNPSEEVEGLCDPLCDRVKLNADKEAARHRHVPVVEQPHVLPRMSQPKRVLAFLLLLGIRLVAARGCGCALHSRLYAARSAPRNEKKGREEGKDCQKP